MGHLTELKAQTEACLPEGVVVAVADPTTKDALLWPQEVAAVAKAVPKRRLEFAAGRLAARQAIAELGWGAQPLPAQADRTPLWPEGLAGSISHDASSCLAVVGPLEVVHALGVDVEPNAPLPEDLIPEICRPDELAWLSERPAPKRGLLARQIFCAKEVVFKAQFPLTGALFGFDILQITFHPHGGRFSARFTEPVQAIPAGTEIHGHCQTTTAHVVATVALGARAGIENANFPVCATR
ncbi:4'-phosphopantetheinyl transferase family protein [Shimia marina]|uniref:Enterobactin synthase component D n=1 Tax=Shimia marina TaxID=321267 RepID=A0A0N7LRL1_9RHOB|nr:4'-phosphopantetheinyl transferase superfamily protein [Shimia marina]CUH51124.1 phosphopantetheinyltransferase component of enterobactin synthase multienzyme complex [Shimia marina]SFD57567.1 4'-phosphopantetheinyl transferase superfamily protein [Shimia marina]